MPVKRIRAARVIMWQNDSLLVQTDLRLSLDERFFRLPGGRMEPGETPAACAARELSEEMGLKIEVGPLWYVSWNEFGRRGKRIQELVFYFQASAPGLPARGPVPTLEAHLGAVVMGREELARERCLPAHLFVRVLADGPAGPEEVVYVEEGTPDAEGLS